MLRVHDNCTIVPEVLWAFLFFQFNSWGYFHLPSISIKVEISRGRVFPFNIHLFFYNFQWYSIFIYFPLRQWCFRWHNKPQTTFTGRNHSRLLCFDFLLFLNIDFITLLEGLCGRHFLWQTQIEEVNVFRKKHVTNFLNRDKNHIQKYIYLIKGRCV
jgi:hypothetical protein